MKRGPSNISILEHETGHLIKRLNMMIYPLMFQKTGNLFSMIEARDWLCIHLYLDEANKKDEENEYPLHKVCNNSNTPLEVVKSIFKSYPDAAMAQNNQKFTPLAIAIECEFEEAVEFLAHAYPEAILLCDDSDITSMQAVVDCMSSHIMVNYLVDAHPESLFIPDNKGISAFHEFFRFWNSFIRVLVDTSEHDSECSEVMGLMHGCGNWKLGDIYKKTLLFLQVASNMADDTWKDLPVHCSFKFESVHWAYAKLILLLHPTHVLLKDKQGNLPIHIILSSDEVTDKGVLECICCSGDSNELYNVETADGGRYNFCDLCGEDMDGLNVAQKTVIKPVKKVHKLVEDLLGITPYMAFIRDCNGRYPLHIAIDSHHSYDIIQMLFHAMPDVGKIRDCNTQLLPFMQAAIDTWSNEQDQITSIYHLLREDPPLLSKF